MIIDDDEEANNTFVNSIDTAILLINSSPLFNEYTSNDVIK